MRIGIMLFILIIVILLGCGTANLDSSSSNVKFKIIRIDSIGNYNLIYAMRNDSIFKIASKKSYKTDCKNIKVNKYYSLNLISSLGDIKVGEFTYSQKNHYVNCFAYDSITTICYENGCVRDLFHMENINGLCLDK